MFHKLQMHSCFIIESNSLKSKGTLRYREGGINGTFFPFFFFFKKRGNWTKLNESLAPGNLNGYKD